MEGGGKLQRKRNHKREKTGHWLKPHNREEEMHGRYTKQKSQELEDSGIAT